MLIWLLVACGEGQRDPFVEVGADGRYDDTPELREVSRECIGGEPVFRARTVGWMSGGTVERYAPAQGGTAELIERLTFTSVGFDPQEWCDIAEASPGDQLSECGDTFEDEVAIIRVWFEEGCAGCVILGPDRELVRDQLAAEVAAGVGFDDSGDCPIDLCTVAGPNAAVLAPHAAGCEDP